MALLGIFIALGAAVAFVVVGALTLFGGVRATQGQLLPGFKPDQPGPLERVLTILSVWLPVLIVAGFCLLIAIQIVGVALSALQ